MENEQDNKDPNFWGKTSNIGSREDILDENGSERVLVSKTAIDDEVEVTHVVHPARMLCQSGQLKAALESGVIDLDEFRQGCIDGMSANRPITFQGQVIGHEPDWAMRLAFRKFITETVEGMPVKRQEIVSRKITTEEDLIKRAKKSPALLKAMIKQLQKLDKEVSVKGGAKPKASKAGS